MFIHPDYLMVNVFDMGLALAFYRDTLGLPLKFESPEWSEFATGATTLALHKVRRTPTGSGDECVEPAAGTCSLGFAVQSLDSTYRELRARGARFVMPPTERPREGIRLAVCLDPDGLPISFAEPLSRGG
jgi:lactoylglutathione lyase